MLDIRLRDSPLWVYSENMLESNVYSNDEADPSGDVENDFKLPSTKNRSQVDRKSYPMFDRRRSSIIGREPFNRIRKTLNNHLSTAGENLLEDSDEDTKEDNTLPIKKTLAEKINKRRESNFAEFERKFNQKIKPTNQPGILVNLPGLSKERHEIPKDIPMVQGNEEQVQKRDDHFSKKKHGIPKKSTVVIIDAEVVLQESHPVSSYNLVESKLKPRMAFSKASTGRLGPLRSSIPLIVANSTVENEVVLVGQKVGNEIVKPKTEIRVHRQIEPTKTLEPIYFKEEKLKKPIRIEKQETEPISIREEDSNKLNSKMDIGVFRQIVDVDAMIPHFAAILEAKKRNIMSGLVDDSNKITALLEAPTLPPLSTNLQFAIPDIITPNLAVPNSNIEIGNPADINIAPKDNLSTANSIATNLTPSIQINTQLSESLISYNPSSSHGSKIEEENISLSRPSTASRIRFQSEVESKTSTPMVRPSSSKSFISSLARDPRLIKSASTRATSASGSSRTQSSCTCLDSSCSYCYSRSSSGSNNPSMSDFGEMASEFALNLDCRDLDGFSKNFSKFKGIEDDPMRNISILDIPIRTHTQAISTQR